MKRHKQGGCVQKGGVYSFLDDSGNVLCDLLLCEQLSRGVLAGGVAHFGGPATHQHDRLVAAPLEVPQQHDLQQAAHVQAVGSRVEAEVGDDAPLGEFLVEGLEVGGLCDETAPLQCPQELGL